MSYILDALKHSDHQRRHSDALKPPLPTLEENQARPSPARSHGLRLSILLMLLLAAGVFAYQQLMLVSTGDAVAALTASDPVPTAASETPPSGRSDAAALYGVQITVSEPRAEVAANGPESSSRQEPAVEKPAAAAPPEPQPLALRRSVPEAKPARSGAGDVQPESPAQQVPPEVIYWRQLPVQIQRSLPPLSFSVHIYSDNPAARMVKINGRMLREGDPVSAGIRLDEITRGGVILQYKEYRFRINPV